MKILAAIALLLLAAVAQAEAIAPITPEEVAALRAKMKALDAEVTQAHKAAADNFAARNAACYKKVLVSSCLDQSRKEDVKARVDIRQQEAEIKRLEREIRLREDATRKAQALQREAETAAQAGRSREESENHEAEYQARQAEHQRRLEEGKQRAAEEAAARARRDATLAGERERKAAARERAAHTPPPPSSGTKPYVPPAIDIPAAPSSIAPKR